MKPIPVTVVVPTRNEERNLPECLSRLIGFFSEVIVVDSCSSDATSKIAADAGAKVVQFSWNGGFPKKRNWVLLNYKFATRWVLFVDADEHLTPAFREELAGHIMREDCVGYWVNYTIHFRNTILRHGIPQKKLALFRVNAGLFERIEDPGWSALDMEVHEHPVIEGQIGEITARVDHLDFRGMHHFIQKHNEYSTWEARRYLSLGESNRSKLMTRQYLKYRYIERWWYPFGYFLLTYIVRGGILDGRAGLVYAIMKFAYFLEVQEKITEACCACSSRTSEARKP